MKQKELVLAALADGPMTTDQVASATGISNPSALLCRMRKSGLLEREKTVRRRHARTNMVHPINRWTITRTGKYHDRPEPFTWIA